MAVFILCRNEVPKHGRAREARAQALQEAQTYLDACQQTIHRQGIAVCAVVCDRSPAEDILKVVNSEKVDLIVMSSHGHGGQAHWTLTYITS
jgi:nucleotide-binding universal stress UspA family protein